MEWEDMQLVLTLATHQNVKRAAKAMDVAPSTIYRRLDKVEQTHGHQLFERLPEGYQPTPVGKVMLAYARQIETLLQRTEDELQTITKTIEGHVRIATLDIAAPFLLPALKPLLQAYPALTLELQLGHEQVNLYERESEVALRMTHHPPMGLWGRRLGKVHIAPLGLADQPESWIITDIAHRPTPLGQWEQNNIPKPMQRLSLSNRRATLDACLQGMGRTLLPTFLTAIYPQLQQLGPTIEPLTSDLWLLTLPELKARPSIQAVFDALIEASKLLNPT